MPASFDTYAKNYDADFTNTPIGLLQRKVVMKHVQAFIHPAKTVLEINCGTGHDARVLSAQVKKYFATDVSGQMIEQCKNKQKINKQNNLRFEKLAIQELDDELTDCDLLFSNFGGLNCLSPEEFQNFANRCSNRIKADCDLLFVLMGRFCIWEQLYFIFKSKFRKAFRRIKRSGVYTVLDSTELLTWYYSPREVKRFFEPNFKTIDQGPVAIFVPPSYLNSFFRKHPALLKPLSAIDKVFTKFGFLANLGDHYYLHLKKRK